MIALLEAKQAGLLQRQHLLSNILAGLVVGVIALPLAMAFAIASGAKPEQGLYTAIIAGLLIAALGGSRVQISGPTGAFIVILSGITARYGVEGLQIATLMAGVFLLGMGLARLGAIIKFIPEPVIVGFTTGIAVIIWVGQWKDFFGLQVSFTGINHFHDKLLLLIDALPRAHWATTGLALLGLLITLNINKLLPGNLKRIPGPLLAMIAVTLIQYFAHFDGVETIGSAFGGIPQGLPQFQLPRLTFTRVVELLGPALTIALLGAIESLLSAVVADGMTGARHDSNQELIGQGIGNIVAPFFGGFAATGALARTATNVRNGGNSPLASFVHAGVLIAIMLVAAPLAAYIPLCALSAILFVVAYNMSELPHFVDLVRRAPVNDRWVLLITFVLTVFADLVLAVNVGVILAALLFMKRMAGTVKVEGVSAAELQRELAQLPQGRLPPGVTVYSIDGPFFFGAAETFERTLKSIGANVKVVIVRLGRVPFIDATGINALREMAKLFQRRGIRMLVCEANEVVQAKLALARLSETLGADNLLPDLPAAIRAADDAAH
ncbi:MAG: sulfate permease [Chitinivorax sp.]